MQKKLFSKKINKQNGFTIIETMIAVSLFLIVVVIGIGSLLNTTSLNRKSQDTRSIMDNLSFIMEDMSKNLRTGYDYHCSNSLSNLSTPLSCASGGGIISFKSSSDGSQWVYEILSDGTLQKSVSGGIAGTFVVLTPPEIIIDPASGFLVTGAETGDNLQPFVTIKLIGTITSENNVVTPFSLQTSISQRLIDI